MLWDAVQPPPLLYVETTLQVFVSTPRNCAVKSPPMNCIAAVSAAGFDTADQDWRRVIAVNKFPWAGDMGTPTKNSVLVYLRPSSVATNPSEVMLHPRLALVSIHMHGKDESDVHTVVRCIPANRIHPHNKLQACIVVGWESYEAMAADHTLPLSVVPVVELWLAACVIRITRKDMRVRKRGPQLGVVPFV